MPWKVIIGNYECFKHPLTSVCNLSLCVFLSAGVLHHRRRSPLLLPGCLRLDVFGGRAAVPHAGRGVWERVLTQKVLLHLWVPHPSCGGGHLSGHRLQKLRHTAGVSVASLHRLFFHRLKNTSISSPLSLHRDTPTQHVQYVLMIVISQRAVHLSPHGKFTACHC